MRGHFGSQPICSLFLLVIRVGLSPFCVRLDKCDALIYCFATIRQQSHPFTGRLLLIVLCRLYGWSVAGCRRRGRYCFGGFALFVKP